MYQGVCNLRFGNGRFGIEVLQVPSEIIEAEVEVTLNSVVGAFGKIIE